MSCVFLDTEAEKQGFVKCDLCERISSIWVLSDFCISPEGLEARAEALITYGNSLPDGVTTEAFAAAELLKRKAKQLREL